MKKTLLFLLSLSAISTHSFSQSWTTLASMPRALSFPVVVELNNEIHVMGGGAAGGATTAHYRYKPTTDTWDSLAPVPYLAQQPSGAVVNGKIHYFGGGFPNSGTPLNKHYSYDPILNSWALETPLPIARVIMEAGSINGKLYAISGQPNKTRVDEYDPTTSTWTLKNALPDNNFWYSALVVHNNEMYRLGGGGYAAPVTSVHKYDSVADSWTSIATLPVALHAPGGASFNGLIYFGGGYANGSETNAVRKFDAANLTFNNVTSLPVARAYHEFVTVGNCLYSVAGNNNSVPGLGNSLLKFCVTPTNTTALSEQDTDEAISIFPNPASDRVYVKGKQPVSAVEVFDISGKQVLSFMQSSSLSEINVSSLEAGVYFLSISSAGKTYHKKIGKQ